MAQATRAARSIYWFSYYVFLAALFMLFFPLTLLSSMSQPPDQAGWVRVLGLVTLIVGFYYWHCGRTGAIEFFRATLVGRTAALLLFALLALLGLIPKPMAFAGVLDFVGAVWTWLSLRKDAQSELS